MPNLPRRSWKNEDGSSAAKLKAKPGHPFFEQDQQEKEKQC